MNPTRAAMVRYTGKATLELLDRVAGGGFKGTVEKAGIALETRVSDLLNRVFLSFLNLPLTGFSH
jgi:hypothetical protein